MKQLFSNIIIYILILFIFSCCKDKPEADAPVVIYEPGDMKTGFATFEKNGKSAKATAMIREPIIDTLYIDFRTFKVDAPFHHIELYEIGHVPKVLGKYKLNKFDVFKKLRYGVLETSFKNLYEPDLSKDNYIEITSIENKKIKGNFQMYLQIDKIREKDNENEPDYLSIEKGYFEGDLK